MFLQFLNCPRVASVNATDRLEAKRFFHAFASPQVHSAHHYRRRSHPGWRRFCLQQRRRQEERRRRPGHMELSKAGQFLRFHFNRSKQPIGSQEPNNYLTWLTSMFLSFARFAFNFLRSFPRMPPSSSDVASGRHWATHPAKASQSSCNAIWTVWLS